jgi:DNA-binding protein Fis
MKPNVGEYFVSVDDKICIMTEEDMFAYIGHPRLLGVNYVIGSIFSSKRKATADEVLSKRVINQSIGDNTMRTQFNITLEEGHDMSKGLKTLEASYIEHVYSVSKYNQVRAAINLGISRGCLRMKLKEYFGDKYL